MSLSVQFLGMTLKNPVIVAAGPWSCDAAAIQKSIDAGAAAVVTETITLEASTRVCPRLYQHGGSLFNTMLYSTIDLEQWEQEIKRIDKRDSILICSVWGATESETAYIAKKVERLGADAIELSISAPIGTRSTRFGRFQEQIGGYVRAVVEAVDLPVMVKLSYDASANVAFVHAVEQAGAQAISAIDSLKGACRRRYRTRHAADAHLRRLFRCKPASSRTCNDRHARTIDALRDLWDRRDRIVRTRFGICDARRQRGAACFHGAARRL